MTSKKVSQLVGALSPVSHVRVVSGLRLIRNTSVQSGLRAAGLRDFSAANSLIYGWNHPSVL